MGSLVGVCCVYIDIHTHVPRARSYTSMHTHTHTYIDTHTHTHVYTRHTRVTDAPSFKSFKCFNPDVQDQRGGPGGAMGRLPAGPPGGTHTHAYVCTYVHNVYIHIYVGGCMHLRGRAYVCVGSARLVVRLSDFQLALQEVRIHIHLPTHTHTHTLTHSRHTPSRLVLNDRHRSRDWRDNDNHH